MTVQPLMVVAVLLTGCSSLNKSPGGFVEDTSDAAVAANRVQMAKAYCVSIGRVLRPGTFRCGTLPKPPTRIAEPPAPLPKTPNPAAVSGLGA